MRRREFIAVLGGAVAWPVAASAQHAAAGVLNASRAAWRAFRALTTSPLARHADRSTRGDGMSSLGQRCSALVVSRARRDGKSQSAMSPAIFATCCGCLLR
jgi:hypothetical protein